MRPVKLFGEKILAFPHFKKVSRWFLILFSILLPLIVVSTAYAAFTWGEITGPVWQAPYYHFSIVVNTLSGPDHYVGLTYTVTHQTVPPTTDPPVCVICSAPGTGPFGCDIPASPGGSMSPLMSSLRVVARYPLRRGSSSRRLRRTTSS